MPPLNLSETRFLGSTKTHVDTALPIYQQIANLPLICPHGHVNPQLFSDPGYQFGSPAELLIIPDHYIFRMLYSQGVSLESLGVPTQDGTAVESDPRKIWQTFAEHAYLFQGTPTGTWLNDELYTLFGIREKLTSESAQRIYDQISMKLHEPEFRPRQLYARFNVEVLCTTDAATDTLEHHQTIQNSDWPGRIVPTFRPDAVVNIDQAGWREGIDTLAEVSGQDVHDYASYVSALEQRRAFFKSMGATATDHAALIPYTERLSEAEAGGIFSKALAGTASADDARRFTAHMLTEMARMSSDDGLVMQLHVGSLRNHNQPIFTKFGLDKGADIPIATEWTRNLQPLLQAYGNSPNFRLILFTLDETTYSRELAPLAGHYPALRLGPPWWFYDSINGMAHFFDRVVETAGIYNTVGFNDDTRAFPSIPARHDVWRRAVAKWLAGQVLEGIIDKDDASQMAQALAYGLAKSAYNL
jgi:glucuronate isomerase